MLKIFLSIEKIFYRIREVVWGYPDYLTAYYRKLEILYKKLTPNSHVLASALIVLVIGLFSVGIVRSEQGVLIEGVIMGSDSEGALQKLNRINPLIPSGIQLERDITELVYEPLIKYEYEQSGDVWIPKITNILASEVIRFREGADYQFSLKKNIRWHDGIPFTADDVARTLQLISSIENRNEAYIIAIKQMQWEVVDPYTIRVCTKGGAESTSCNQTSDNPILSNFLELIAVKIIPAHRTTDVNVADIDSSQPELFRSPVGTGIFRFSSIDSAGVVLSYNRNYHEITEELPFSKIQFRMFRNFEEAVTALETGAIHTLAASTTEYNQDIDKYKNINQFNSPVLANQFWGLYFNMRKKPDGATIAPAFLQDKSIRQAISFAIDREQMIANALQGAGEQAFGPIASKSEFFNPNAPWASYNKQRAIDLLDATEWVIRKDGDVYRTNAAGETMSFSLYFVNSFDRLNVGRSVQRDLEEVGIKVVIDRREMAGQETGKDAPEGWSLEEINNQFLSPRLFDVILYGMNTFIDPDRYELFHSSQEKTPGLNLSGYKGSEETVQVGTDANGNRTVIRVSKVDNILENTRKLDPLEDKERRKTNYQEFQTLLADDAPVVFLYHPKFIYYASNRIKQIDLFDVNSLETRFRNISNWEF
jgi:peptide/nickel transport system substrate-binding protein